MIKQNNLDTFPLNQHYAICLFIRDDNYYVMTFIMTYFCAVKGHYIKDSAGKHCKCLHTMSLFLDVGYFRWHLCVVIILDVSLSVCNSTQFNSVVFVLMKAFVMD